MKKILPLLLAATALATGGAIETLETVKKTTLRVARGFFLKPSTSPDLCAWMLRRNLEIDSYRAKRKEANKAHRGLKSAQPIADFLTECGLGVTLDAHLSKAGLGTYVEPKNIVTAALAVSSEPVKTPKARTPRKPKTPAALGSEPVKRVRKPSTPKDPSAAPRVRAPRKAKVAP